MSLADTISQQMLNMMQNSFQLQKQQIDSVNAALGPYLTPQGQGYTPQQMAYLNSQMLANNNTAYNSAGSNLRSLLGSRGEGTGALPPGTTYSAPFAALESARSSDQMNAFRQNELANIQQALTNKFNAAGITAGLGGQYGQGVGQFGSNATSAGNAATNASLYGPGNLFLNTLAGGGAKAGLAGLGGLLSNMMTGSGGGSLGNLFSSGGINLSGADLGTTASLISSLTGSGGGGGIDWGGILSGTPVWGF